MAASCFHCLLPNTQKCSFVDKIPYNALVYMCSLCSWLACGPYICSWYPVVTCILGIPVLTFIPGLLWYINSSIASYVLGDLWLQVSWVPCGYMFS